MQERQAAHRALLCALGNPGGVVLQELAIPDLELGHLLRARDDKVLQPDRAAGARCLSVDDIS